MSKSNYRNLVVWQRSRELAVAIYSITRAFPRHEIFCMTQQFRKAALSVAYNIAEGHGRRTARDVLHFLGIARGSLLEVETQLVIATDLEYIDGSTSRRLEDQTLEVTRLLNGLMTFHERRLTRK